MRRFFQDPVVRLFLRALLAGGIAFSAKYLPAATGGHVSDTAASLRACLVAGGLAFAEVFTPLNSLVGLFRKLEPAPGVIVAAPADPIEPPGDTTEAQAA